MKNFHKEFPRLFNRASFINHHDGEWAVGCGRVTVNVGKWYIYLEGPW